MKTIDAIVWQEVKYISYGRDPKFFKIQGKDLYYNTGTIEKPKYEILKGDYNAMQS
jgi:hypothetical protein